MKGMKNMNDNEIIKALECCIKDEWLCASKCPGHKLDGNFKEDCRFSLMKISLDLINRQKAEIEKLEIWNTELFYKIVGVMHSIDKWLDGDELKQDEVNRAITMREKTLKITEKQQAEIERLTKIVEEQHEGSLIAMEVYKNEAIKKLTEKLYEKVEQNSKFGFAYVTKKEIENVVRELEGEDDV